jgi:hypothetical protein
MQVRRPTIDDARAAWWTGRSLVACRRQLRDGDVHQVELPPAQEISADSSNIVSLLLRGARAKCLTNALVIQAWRNDHGDPVDVVIGVKSPGHDFSAHAWLADAPEGARGGHEPIHRLAPRERGSAVA